MPAKTTETEVEFMQTEGNVEKISPEDKVIKFRYDEELPNG